MAERHPGRSQSAALLTNNVLTSQITHDVSNTARVRYYDRQDNTPTLNQIMHRIQFALDHCLAVKD